MDEALDALLDLRRGAMGGVIGRLAEEEEEEQLRAFEREAQPAPAGMLKSIQQLQQRKAKNAHSERSSGDSLREEEEEEYRQVTADLAAVAAKMEAIRNRMESNQTELRVSESAFLNQTPLMANDNETDWSIVAPPQDDLDESLIPERFEHQITEPPLFTICYKAAEEESTRDIKEIKGFILSIDPSNIAEKDIRLADITEDIELIGLIKALSGELNLPAIFIQRSYIGGFSRLQELHTANKLKDYLSLTSASSEPELRVIDKALEGVEALMSFINPMSWIWSSSSSAESTAPEFEVIHTNWYYRQLKRKFRFFDLVFLRINPRDGAVRASRKYSEISQIVVADSRHMEIHYKATHYPDYIAASPQQIEEMLAIFAPQIDSNKIEDRR
eukprot:TRINITY_DN14882_c0_g1_i1.p1 TRINITY_DN14882_c0_g1~~TRINITY_DN14882_c0_g1_i1.p1  ORF type:complete len:424 (-),score=92.13 TRINITY_DN14882_c0_g1_i1:38-1201(-)